MSFALFIATGSFFLGQQKVFPRALRGLQVWFVPAFLPLLLLIYWLFRVCFTKMYKGDGSGHRKRGAQAALREQTLSL